MENVKEIKTLENAETLEEMLQEKLAVCKNAKMFVLAADAEDDNLAIAVAGNMQSAVDKVNGIVCKMIGEIAEDELDKKALAMTLIDTIVKTSGIDYADIALLLMLRKEN